MPKLLPVIIFAICTCTLHAQADMLVLKKKNKTIQRFYTGSPVSVRLADGFWLNGIIRKMKEDTLVIQPMVERIGVTYFGSNVVDTTYMNNISVAVNQITGVPRENESFVYIRDGTLLQIGGAGYTALNVINTATQNEKLFDETNTKRLIGGVSAFAVGTAMKLMYKKYLPLGKKYSLRVLLLSPSK